MARTLGQPSLFHSVTRKNRNTFRQLLRELLGTTFLFYSRCVSQSSLEKDKGIKVTRIILNIIPDSQTIR